MAKATGTTSGKRKGLTYADAGVHFATHNRLVTEIFKRVRSTYSPRVMELDDGFGGLFSLDNDKKLFERNYRHPVLVSCTDGVGTKLKLAFALKKHDTVGIDCVAMSINDMLCLGAEPLFFLDYIATGQKDLRVLLPLIAGVVEGCKQSGCALLGGETAEMPGFYPKGEYDVAGFAVGVVEKKQVIRGTGVKPGDLILGLESSGLHSNGFSLVRKIMDRSKLSLKKRVPELGRPLGEELLTPTRIYARAISAALSAGKRGQAVHGIANITGGGIMENIPRVLPLNCQAVIETRSWTPPPIFGLLQEWGNVSAREMFHVFNMGIGMVVIAPAKQIGAMGDAIEAQGVRTRVIGEIRQGSRKVVLK